MPEVGKRDAYLELLVEPVVVAFTFKDTDGRPLAEMSASRATREGVEFDLRECPFQGSRFSKVMNVSALQQITAQWSPMLGDLAKLRNRYLKDDGGELNLGRFWRFARAITSLPVYVTRRSAQPVSEHGIPSRLSALFKTGQGLHMVAEQMLISGVHPQTSVSTDQVIEYAEANDLFLSFDGSRACSGPPEMIHEFVATAIERDFGGHQPLDRWLERTVGEFTPCFDYADAVSDGVLGKLLFEAECRIAMERLVKAIEMLDGPTAETARGRLRPLAEKRMSRFGRLKDTSTERLAEVRLSLDALSPSTWSRTAVEERFAGAIAAGTTLEETVRARNQLLEPQVVDLCADHLRRQLEREGVWLSRFEAVQGRVLLALGRAVPQPALTRKDLSGMGVPLAEVLSSWLGIELRDLILR